MKTPRLDGFIPKPIPTLSSPIDDYPSIEQPKAKVVPAAPEHQPAPMHEQVASSASPTPNDIPVRPYGRTPERTDGRTPVRRSITRYAFEFYLDQIDTLKQLSLDAKVRGE